MPAQRRPDAARRPPLSALGLPLQWPLWLVAAAIALAAPSLSGAPGPQAPGVVVLSSYHEGYDWSDREVAGLLERLREAYPSIDPVIEHLDAKRNPDPGHTALVGDYLAARYKGRPPDLVVTLDNPAFDLVLAERSRVFPGAPVVFAGVNDFHSSRLAGQKGITGVAEVQSTAATVGVALAIHKPTRTILFVHDATSSGLAARREAEAVMAARRAGVKALYLEPSTFDDAARRIAGLPPGSLAVILSFVTDSAGLSLPLAEGTRRLTAQAKVPVYAMHETRLGHGIEGGVLIAGRDHGRQAGDLAIRVLAGEDPSTIQPVAGHAGRPMFDYAVLARHGISLAALPRGSTVVNVPQSFLGLSAGVLLAAVGVFVALTALVIILTASVARGKQAERALRRSEETFRLAMSAVEDGLWDWDVLSGNAYYSPGWAKILGYDTRQVAPVIGFWRDRVREEDLGPTMAALDGHLAGRQPMFASEHRLRTRDGTWKWVLARGRVVERASDGTPLRVLGTMVDVSERRQAQDRLRAGDERLAQTHRLEAIGRLAGGIAHDFNNLLTVIRGYNELILQAKGRHTGNALEVKRASERAAELVGQLLAFARRQPMSPAVLPLNAVVTGMGTMLRRLIGDDIVLEVALEAEPSNVRADRGRLEQVLMNLAANARDAMPAGGTLRIATGLVRVEEGRDGEVGPGRYVALTVRDTGQGMASDTRARLFEPFFTTKAQGKGTGLGLSTTYGIVKQSGGFISCDSEPGKGTTFTILLPPAGEEAPPPSPARSARPPGGTERILLVEDNDAVRRITRTVLRGRGYRVLEARDGEEALRLVQERVERGEQFDLIITDVLMPRMGGCELARRCASIEPHTRVLLVSGYSEEAVSLGDAMARRLPFVKKPFSADDLLAAVRRALAGEREHARDPG